MKPGCGDCWPWPLWHLGLGGQPGISSWTAGDGNWYIELNRNKPRHSHRNTNKYLGTSSNKGTQEVLLSTIRAQISIWMRKKRWNIMFCQGDKEEENRAKLTNGRVRARQFERWEGGDLHIFINTYSTHIHPRRSLLKLIRLENSSISSISFMDICQSCFFCCLYNAITLHVSVEIILDLRTDCSEATL